MNTFDHLSVALDLPIDTVINAGSKVPDSPNHIVWNKLTQEQIHNKYTLPLDERFTQLVVRYGLLNYSVGGILVQNIINKSVE